MGSGVFRERQIIESIQSGRVVAGLYGQQDAACKNAVVGDRGQVTVESAIFNTNRAGRGLLPPPNRVHSPFPLCIWRLFTLS